MKSRIDHESPSDRFLSRIPNLQKILTVNNVGGILLTYSRDILYFTGTAQPSYLVITPDEYRLFVKSGYKFANQEVFIEPSKFVEERKLDKVYQQVHSGFFNNKIGLQMDVLTAQEFLQIKKIFKGMEFFNVSPMTLSIRSVKDKYEIEQIKKACRCAQKGYEAACSILKPGISELELSAAVEYAHRLAGHEGDFFFGKMIFS